MRGAGDRVRAPRGGGVASPNILYTIGHSTRPIEELMSLLGHADVDLLLDVRTAPGSRRNPQFGRDALSRSLSANGIQYLHEPALGGFRKPAPDSPNGGWENSAFRGYADYMATTDFAEALEHLQDRARQRTACIMCAEAQWWRCHRRLIADALLVRGWRVLHLGVRAHPVEHELTSFAVVGADRSLTYPAAQGELLSAPA